MAKFFVEMNSILFAGVFLDWIIGYFSSWRIAAACGAANCAILIITMIFLPETPYWLVENNQIEAAKKSLIFFRGTDYNVDSELNEIKEKFMSKQKVDGRSISSISWILKRFWSAAFLKPFLCIGMTLIISNLTGFEVINLYMVPILQESGSNIDAEIGTIIVGGVRVLSAGK